MKSLDAVVGRAAALLLPRPKVPAVLPAIGRVLFIRPGGIGDAVHLVPAIRVLRHALPEAVIHVLAERRNAGTFALAPEVDLVLLYDRPRDLFRGLTNSYDLLIDTEQWHRLSAVVGRLIAAPVSVGFATNERSRLFTHPVAYSQDTYEMENFLGLLEPFGIGAEPPQEPFLAVSPTAVAEAGDLLGRLPEPFVTLFTGASIPERRWGSDRYARLAELLTGFGVGCVVVGGDGERGEGEYIEQQSGAVNLAGRTSLAVTAAVLVRSSLLVSGDSGVLHLAVGVGCPTVSLFGPGRARKWAPRGKQHLVINRELPCSPCTTFGTTPPCSDNARCMAEIGVDEVFNAAIMLLTATGAVTSRCCKRDWIEVGKRITAEAQRH